MNKFEEVGISGGSLNQLKEIGSKIISLYAKGTWGEKIDKKLLTPLYEGIRTELHGWVDSFLGRGGELTKTTEEAARYGFKYSRLKEQERVLQQASMRNVTVPATMGVSTGLLHTYLDEVAPGVGEKWLEVGKRFAECKEENRTAFLMQPETKELLGEIERMIVKAFKDPRALSLLDQEEGLASFLKMVKAGNHHLMVRSSGAEDGLKMANAGGNLSLSYVRPEANELLEAIGQVVASYYAIPSLRNRLQSDKNENPFATKQHIAVCLQQLIGEEPLQNSSAGEQEKNPPVSVVLFSNEPTYVGNEPFRIMRISASYGHGEGVVGAAGIRTDTYTILCSEKDPSKPYILREIGAKEKRLAPILDSQGVVTLQRVKNDSSLVHRAALDDRQLTRLFYLGQVVESIYGNQRPMDMELVIQGESIYPVQARPVNRPTASPSYVDAKLLEEESRYKAEPFLPGRAEVQLLANSDELLIADSLEEAQAGFDSSLHKLVIVRQEEPANSHPVVNFSGLGVPVLYNPNHDTLRSFVEQSDSDGKMLVACVQTGNLWAIDSDTATEKLIREGYVVHPARIRPSLDGSAERSPLRNASTEAMQPNEELKRMVTNLRALEVNGATLPRIRELKRSLLDTLGKKIQRLTELTIKDATLPYLHEMWKATRVWEQSIRQAIGEWKHATKGYSEGDHRLQHLWHAKVVEQLATHSRVDLEKKLAGLELIAAHCERNGGSKRCSFAKEALYRNSMMTEEQSKRWDRFLDNLESARQKGLLTEEEAQTFQQGLRQLDSFDLLPLWMAHSFLPAFHQCTEESAFTALRLLSSQFPKPENLSYFQELDYNLTVLQGESNIFASPERFEKAFASLKETISHFSSLKAIPEAITDNLRKEIKATFSPWADRLQASSSLEKLIAYKLMNKAVTLYDSSIKAMKGSQSFSNEQKIAMMKRMLPGYYALLADWHLHLSSSKIAYHWKWPLVKYLTTMENLFANMGEEAALLNSSPNFNVGAARLGAVTAFERSFPSTLEDFFTLTHQNIVTAIEALTVEESGHIELPESLVQCQEALEKIFGPHHPEIQLMGYEISSGEIQLHYNYPQRNHSIQFTLSFDKENQGVLLKISFLGTARDRWHKIACLAELYKETGLTKLISPPVIKPMSLELNFLFDKQNLNQSKSAFFLLKIGAAFAMDDLLPPDQELQHALGLTKAQDSFAYLKKYEEEKAQSGDQKWILNGCIQGMTIPYNLRDDKRFMLQVVKYRGNAINEASHRLARDPLVIMTAVRNDGFMLSLIKDWSGLEKFKEKIILAAVQQNGLALQEITDWNGLDGVAKERIYLAAVQQNRFALQYITDWSGLDGAAKERIYLAVVQQNGLTVQYITNWSGLDGVAKERIYLAAVQQNRCALQYITDWRGLDGAAKERIFLAVVQQDWLALGDITDWIGLDGVAKERIFLAALQQDIRAVQFVPQFTDGLLAISQYAGQIISRSFTKSFGVT